MVLVHGATADHTAWRTVAPLLAPSHTLYAIDRRGRGASGDTPPYAIAREYEDVASVVDAVAAAEGRPVDVVGHSYGGRVEPRSRPAQPEPAPARRVRGRAGPRWPLVPGCRGDEPARGARGGRRSRGPPVLLPGQRGRDERGRTGFVSPRPELAGPRRGRADGGAGDVGRGRRGRRTGALRGRPDPGPPDHRRRQPAGLQRRHVGPRPPPVERASWRSSRAQSTPPTTPIPSASRPRSAPSRESDLPFGHD